MCIHVYIQAVVYMCFIKGGFKKKFYMAKKIATHFDHYNLINKEESTIQICYESTTNLFNNA